MGKSRESVSEDKVLIISKSSEISDKISKILSKSGFTDIEYSSTLKNSYSLCAKSDYSLIIHDFSIERKKECNGVRKIISINPKAKILLLAGLEHRELILKALHCGIKEFVFKPIDSPILLFKIKRILRTNPNPSEKEFLIQFFSQIIEDVPFYLEESLRKKIKEEIKYICRDFAKKNADYLYFDEILNQIQIRDDGEINFSHLNKILEVLLDLCKEKVENYIPTAKSLFIESFRMNYMKNLENMNKMEKKISFPDWLNVELKFLDQLVNFVFTE